MELMHSTGEFLPNQPCFLTDVHYYKLRVLLDDQLLEKPIHGMFDASSVDLGGCGFYLAFHFFHRSLPNPLPSECPPSQLP